MSGCQLSEELLHEILTLHFYPQLNFRCAWPKPGPQSQRRSPGEARSSDVLLVSKQWLRIGTPIMYEFIILSSPRHMKTVADLLCASPHLGRRVRHLRVQIDCYGGRLFDIVRCSPNIEKLLLQLTIDGHHDISELVSSMKEWQPRELYLHSNQLGWNARAQIVQNALVAALPTYTHLKRIYLGQESSSVVGRAISRVPALEEVSLSSLSALRWLKSDALPAIVRMQSIKTVFVRCGSFMRGYSDLIASTESLIPNERHAILRYKNPSEADEWPM